MKVTSIKQQQKNPDRVSIYIDAKYGFSLDLNQLLDLKIKTGQEIDDGQLKKFEKISEVGKKKMTAVNWLMVRPRSEKEFRQYLNRKKIENEVIESWTSEFNKRKYLDDDKFAKWWAQSMRQNKNSSSKKIKLELMQKGVSNDNIEVALAELETDEISALRTIIVKKAGLTRYKQDRNKFVRYLIGQGFKYADIINELNYPANTKDT